MRRRTMSLIGLVLAWYLLAFYQAEVALEERLAATMGPEAQASSGMYAFGDAVLYLAVLGGWSVIPTALALYLLRPVAAFWKWLMVGSLAMAATAVGSLAVVVLVALLGVHEGGWRVAEAYGMLRLLGSFPLAVGFLVFAACAPPGRSRRGLLLALGMEGGAVLLTVARLLLLRG